MEAQDDSGALTLAEPTHRQKSVVRAKLCSNPTATNAMIDGVIGKIRSTVVRALQHIHISFAGLDF